MANLAEPVDAADFTDAVDAAFCAPVTEVVDCCLEVADLAEPVDAVDFTDAVDAAFCAPVTEVVD